MLLEDTRRLEKIDQLYSLRLDQLISLPVLVVVGDQSSGKSSVLEALTGLPLPRDSGLCTRFPTQILFKRSPEHRVDVNIILASEADTDLRQALQDFTKRHSRSSQSLNDVALLEVIKEASQLMGLHDRNDAAGMAAKSFSNHLLKIEMSHPEYDHFSVVDLPGLFRSMAEEPTAGQTTKEDMALVRRLVSSHLSNERSIILAVVPSNVDIATQEIIQMAEDADRARRRTLAVLTKPDLVDKGAEIKVVDMVNQSNERAGLGYTVVCNRSQSELDISLRDRHTKEEAFFKQHPWNTITPDRAGISALKQRLNNLALEATRRTFDDVATEVTRKLGSAKSELESVGSPRHTPENQRLFLLQMASEYQSLAKKAIDAYYGRDECFSINPSLRLAAVIMEENERFSHALFSKGSYRKFPTAHESDTDSGSEQGDDKFLAQRADENNHDKDIDACADGLSDWKNPLNFLEQCGLPEIGKSEHESSKESVEAWIARRYREFKGFEVGSSNPSLITALVFEQTSSWLGHALQHMSNVIKRIHRCIFELLIHVCPDGEVHARLWKRLRPGLCAAYQRAVDHTRFLVKIEREGYPLTLNHYFAQTMAKRRKRRIEQRLRKMQTWTTSDDARQPLLRISDVLDAYISNEQHSVEELQDILQSYHKVARKRFVDNICKQAVDHFLVCSDEGPLYMFSAEFVGKLPVVDLQHLAGEDTQTTLHRQKLQAEIEILTRAREIVA